MLQQCAETYGPPPSCAIKPKALSELNDFAAPLATPVPSGQERARTVRSRS